MLGSDGTTVIAMRPVSPVTDKMDKHSLVNCDKIRSARSKLEMDTRTCVIKLGHLCQKLKHTTKRPTTKTSTKYHKNRSVMQRVEMDAHTRKPTQPYYNTQEAPHFVYVVTRPHK